MTTAIEFFNRLPPDTATAIVLFSPFLCLAGILMVLVKQQP